MNVSLPKLSLFLALLYLPLWQYAQGVVTLETYQDTEVSHVIGSSANDPSTPITPSNGTISWEENPIAYYTLTYQPDSGFVGQDHFRVIYFTPIMKIQDVKVNVNPALIRANHDYAYTSGSLPVSIDVLANDLSSTGVKNLTVVPAANHGTAIMSGGMIKFTPAAGFKGLAHFNYVVCNEFGNCDEGTVSVTVMDGSAPAQDTLQVFTKKNKSQYILAPDSYLLSDGPDHGFYDPAGDIPTYTPLPGYVGPDKLEFSMGASKTVFQIEVLDLKDNAFAIDDRAYTIANEPVTISVLGNDAYGLSAGCFSFGQPTYGTVAKITPNPAPGQKGILVYTPPTNFIGVDEFTYTSYPPQCGGEAETATVYIFVSNFEPAQSTFRMATPKETPMIIGYNVPASTYRFMVTKQGTLGQAMFLDGVVDTTIMGQQLAGNDLLIYVPNPGVSSGLDKFEIKYCLEDPLGGCAVARTVKIEMDILDVGNTGPVCVGDCVWAGDTNFDGIVNMHDLLPIGWAMGEIGKPRPNATMDFWYGQYADDWSDLFANAGAQQAPNLKHIDANGDSIVTAADTLAISEFYGRTHTMVPRELPFSEYDIYLDGPLFANPGDLVELKVVLGSPSAPAADVHGFVFPFNYDPNVFVPESVRMIYAPGNWLAYDSPVLSMEHNDMSGRFESGFTRTSGVPASGFGDLGSLNLVIVEDVAGFRPGIDAPDHTTVRMGDQLASLMNGDGQMSSVYVHPFELNIVPVQEEDLTPEEVAVVLADKLKVFPNPVQDVLVVHLNGGREFGQLRLSDMHGRVVMQQGGLATNHLQLNVGHLPNGVYTLTVVTPEGLVNKKIEVLR